MAQFQRFAQLLGSRIAVASAFVVLGAGAYCARSSFLPTTYAESKEPRKMFSGLGFTSLRVHSIKIVNHDTKRLVFEFPDPEAVSGLSLTSSILTFSRPQGSWLPAVRPYTPISDLAQPGFVELMVKQYPNGKASTHLHLLAPGDSLTFITALKGFSWKANQFSQVYLVAGGAGITPIYQLIRGILDNPDDKTKINLVFGVNTEQDLLLREEFDEYKRRFPDRFNYVYTVSHPAGENSLVRKGRVTEELLREVVKETSDKETKVFVCGPPAMEQSLVGSNGSPGILKNLGFAKEQIYQF